MTLSRRRFGLLAAIAACTPYAHEARAQAYPTRAVRVIVAYAPGGLTDVFGRLLAQKLGERMGKQFYVENITGASGNIGMAQAAKAAPDGYTILCAYSSYTVNPSLFDKIPYDPEKDFVPVTLAVTSPAVLSVNASVPARTVDELVALIRANPGKYSFASAGAGTQSHLTAEQFRLKFNLDLVHVPYNGGGPAIAAVVAGHVPISFVAPAPVVPHLKEGQLRALALAGKARSQILPDLPTMAEIGYPDIEGESWVGMLVPAGTPQEIVATLYDETAMIMKEQDMRESLATLGYEPVASTPLEFAERIRRELGIWAKVIRAANIKAN
ncbi:MAG TPA: tripartite tricarboxylate transporter substrate binding protein [Xanthobacteraceae bacterium]